MIYIDPPYNTGNDFVYDDNFTEPIEEYLRRTGQVDEKGKALTTNKRTNGRFHSKWLSMMYPRLRLARNLLREDGVIFISIDDNEMHNLKLICDEVLGEENFIANIVWQRSKKGDAKFIANIHEYILVYVKNKDKSAEKGIWRRPKEGVEEVIEFYKDLRKKFKNNHEQVREEMQAWYRDMKKEDPRKNHKHYSWSDDRGLYFAADFAGPDDGRAKRPRHDIIHPIANKPCKKPSTGWRWDENRTNWALEQNPPRIHFGKDETTIPNRKSYLVEIDSEPFPSVFYTDGRSATLEVEKLIGKGIFSFPKNKEVIRNLVNLVCEDGDNVLDFFSGSGSTAHAVIDMNKDGQKQINFICIQIPEPSEEKTIAFKKGYKFISDIGKERIRKSINSALHEITPTKNKQKNEMPLLSAQEQPIKNQIDLGFKVFKLGRSNYSAWEEYDGTDPKEFIEYLKRMELPIRDAWTEEGLLTEAMMLEGFPLHSKIILREDFKKNIVKEVSSDFCDHRLLICLDEKIDDKTIDAIDLNGKNIFICQDSAVDDERKLRLSDKGFIKTI